MSPERSKAEAEQRDRGLVVVVDSLSIGASEVVPFVERVLEASEKTSMHTKVLLAMHRGLDPNSDVVDKAVKKEFRELASSIIVDEHTFAYAYLKGLETAMGMAGRVIELDSGGGHKPEEIGSFIEELDNFDIVLSSRFMEGSVNTYPLQRKAVSKAVTILSNQFLGTDLTDAASGFQGFRSEVLKDLFETLPPEEWISALHGPFHMYQTEIRAMLSSLDKYSYKEIPITYGSEKTGKPFPITYIAQSMVCFFRIAKNRQGFEQRLHVK